jgi:isopentenyl phosphate kinase
MPAEPGPSIVKLGGSVITRKRGPPRLRPKVLTRLAEEVADGGRLGTVLLHGAGSFGHPGAVRWRLALPPAATDPPHARRRGATLVSAEVRRLHVAVLTALLDAGVPAWSVPAGAVATNDGGRLASLDPAPFRRALDAGLVPVGFGDVVADASWGFSILSADTIAVALAGPLKARRVLFVSDVDGVLERPPGAPGRPKARPRVTREILAGLAPAIGAPDVTGGIRGKAEAMLAIAAVGVDAGLISGLRHGSLARALRGEAVYGSWTGPGFP